ncbi:hypothetical protein [Longirhabdus pacifica]|uniref:hypothetical protein n=1 Tax=Longirhabdus pacifica TaxID=2305227 RepID=UPI0010090CFE|nr:hypothetical protein [Longirhabdus pacifica]
MENISHFLRWVFGLVITLFILSAGILLYNLAQPMLWTANNQASDQARMIIDSEYTAYDYQIVSGSQLLTAYRRYGDQQDFTLYVKTSNKNFGVYTDGTTGSCTNFDFTTGSLESSSTMACNVTQQQLMEGTSDYYISPQARFISTLVRDKNDIIRAIYFQQQ